MCLPVFTAMIKTMKINTKILYNAAKGGFTNATDAADWLVKHGVPFRDAHSYIGKLVAYCLTENKSLEDLTIQEFKTVADIFDSTIYDAIKIEKCVQARNVIGGPSKEYILKLIEINEKYLTMQEV